MHKFLLRTDRPKEKGTSNISNEFILINLEITFISVHILMISGMSSTVIYIYYVPVNGVKFYDTPHYCIDLDTMW